MALINCRNLKLGYDGVAIVEGISFEVNSGDYLCIVGENGSGKSTLMKALLKLNTPLDGEIEFGEGLLHTEIGYLPQQTQVQRDFPASVYEIVLSGCLNGCGMRPFYTKEQKSRALDNMEKMGISDLKGRSYKSLSGGQQQRVLLARALCATTKILLLDEPVAGLDPKVTAKMYEQISVLNKEYGITVIMISHDIGAAVRYSSHILHINHNSVFFGKKEDYLSSNAGKSFIGGMEDL